MKLAYTILYVEDVRSALDFYVAAFGLTIQFLHESGDYGELATGDSCLAFSSRELMRQLNKNPLAANAGAPSFEIAFATDDVAAALAQALNAGAVLVQPATPMPWGQTLAYVADPDGFLIELCTPIVR